MKHLPQNSTLELIRIGPTCGPCMYMIERFRLRLAPFLFCLSQRYTRHCIRQMRQGPHRLCLLPAPPCVITAMTVVNLCFVCRFPFFSCCCCCSSTSTMCSMEIIVHSGYIISFTVHERSRRTPFEERRCNSIRAAWSACRIGSGCRNEVQRYRTTLQAPFWATL